MHILLHSHTFHPAVGGVETISATLAEQLISLGHSVVVVTETPGESTMPFSFEVVRCPSIRERLRLARSADIIHSNGASLGMVPYALLSGVPFAWTHNGYQITCIDGLGWDDNGPTPLTPWLSFQHHLKRLGIVKGVIEGVKLAVRRLTALFYAHNIAATKWVAKRLRLKSLWVSYTPYPLDRFCCYEAKIELKFDFVFVGRMVNEKGVETLIQAVKILRDEYELHHLKLALVGDGALREKLEKLVNTLEVRENIEFLGVLQGDELSRVIRSAPIGIVPSIYEEPMGGVALELLAAGRCVIVSERGGMAECVGDAGICFKNGDATDLADKMRCLIFDESLKCKLLEKAKARILMFKELGLTNEYIRVYQEIIQKTRRIEKIA